MKPIHSMSVASRAFLGICGAVDLGFVAAFAFGVATGGLGKNSWAIWLFVLALLLFSLFGVYALNLAVRGFGFPFSKPVFIVASIIHVVLGLLVQIGPGSVYRISALIIVGTIYFAISFKTTNAQAVAT